MIQRYNCQEKLDASHSLGWKGWLTHSRDKAYCNSLMWDQWLTTRHFTGLSIHDLTPTTIPRQPCPAVNSYISILFFFSIFPPHFISFFSLSFLWIPLYLMFSHFLSPLFNLQGTLQGWVSMTWLLPQYQDNHVQQLIHTSPFSILFLFLHFFPFISFFSLSFLWIPLYLMFSHLFIFSHLFLIYVIFTFFLFSLFLSNFLFFISLCFFPFSLSLLFFLLFFIFSFAFNFFLLFLFFFCFFVFCVSSSFLLFYQ